MDVFLCSFDKIKVRSQGAKLSGNVWCFLLLQRQRQGDNLSGKLPGRRGSPRDGTGRLRHGVQPGHGNWSRCPGKVWRFPENACFFSATSYANLKVAVFSWKLVALPRNL